MFQHVVGGESGIFNASQFTQEGSNLATEIGELIVEDFVLARSLSEFLLGVAG